MRTKYFEKETFVGRKDFHVFAFFCPNIYVKANFLEIFCISLPHETFRNLSSAKRKYFAVFLNRESFFPQGLEENAHFYILNLAFFAGTAVFPSDEVVNSAQFNPRLEKLI